MDSLLREEQVELAVTCAVSILGIRRGLTPIQQSRFNTPWVKAPESQGEQFHQDLVWVYKVLPPNDNFNPDLAVKGVYKKLRLKALDDFWSNYDPDQDKATTFRHRYKPSELTNKNKLPTKIRVKPPSFRCRGTENV